MPCQDKRDESTWSLSSNSTILNLFHCSSLSKFAETTTDAIALDYRAYFRQIKQQEVNGLQQLLEVSVSLACCVGIFPAHRDTESDELEERGKGAAACARPPALTGKLNRRLKSKTEDDATNTMSHESRQARNAAAATESNPDFAAYTSFDKQL